MKTVFSILFCFCFIATAYTVSAQGTGSVTTEPQAGTKLTLQQCIDLALERNITIKTAENSLALAKLDYRQSIYNYAPNVSAGLTFNRNAGPQLQTQINPLTGELTVFQFNQGFESSSPSITAQIPLFAGLSRLYTLQQNKNALSASEKALEDRRIQITLSVIRSYLQVVLDQANIDIVRYRIRTLEVQQEREQRRFDAGAGVKFDVLNVQSQLAVESQNLINAINQLQNDRITLLQILQRNPSGRTEEGDQFAGLDTVGMAQRIVTDVIPSVTDVERNALTTLPSVKQQEFNLIALRYSRKNAWGAYLPTLTFTGSLRASYNSLVPLSYTQQLDQTRGQYFWGFNLNIPILNGWSANRQSRGANIVLRNAELAMETTKNTVVNDVRTAHLNLSASRARYTNVSSQQTAQDEAFTNAEARFNAGLINFQEYVQVLNNRTSLQQQKVQAVYEYILRKKIVDFYNGKPITFNEK